MTSLPDRQILQLLAELKAAAPGFLWESAIWAGAANRRSPYRALLLFGLSPRTKDAPAVGYVPPVFPPFSRRPGPGPAPG